MKAKNKVEGEERKLNQVKRPYEQFAVKTKGKKPADFNLGVKEAAEIMGVSHATIRHYTNLGVLPARIMPSGYRKYARADVEALANKLTPV